MARSLLLSSAVAVAAFGVASAEFLKVSKGPQATAMAIRCQPTAASTDAYCIASDSTGLWKWTGTYAGGKFSAAVAAAGTVTASLVTGTSLPTTVVGAQTAARTDSNKLVHVVANADGTFLGALDFAPKSLLLGTGVNGAIVSLTSAGVMSLHIGSGDTTDALIYQFKTGAGAVDTGANVVATKLADAAAAACADSAACVQVPRIFAMACNGVATYATSGTVHCIFGHHAAATQAKAQLTGYFNTGANAGVVYGATGAGGTAAWAATGTSRAVIAGGAVKFAATSYFIYADKHMIRQLKAPGAAPAAGTKVGETATDVGFCDALINAGGTCATAAPTIPTAGTGVYKGLALSVVSPKQIIAFWVASDALSLIFVDQTTAPAGTAGGAAGVHTVVRCTYASKFVDAGSQCTDIATYAPAASGTPGNIQWTGLGVTAADVFNAPLITKGRENAHVFGIINALATNDHKVQTLAYGAFSRTVTPQTPVPNCKRNGRKYCTKTKTLVKATTTTSTNGTSTNGSSTNASSNSTKTTTTTTSASAPLLASAWAMVGVVAALIAA